MREILSLQFGHYSNFIGAHLWNIQETSFDYTGTTKSEINHDVLYREGATTKGETTFTPRLLLVDLKGSLRTLPEHGNLYETVVPEAEAQVASTSSTLSWPDNRIEIIKQEHAVRNSFQEAIEKPITDLTNLANNLDREVTVWSDYLYSRFHPRSVNIIKQYQHDEGTALNVFETYPLGTDLWKTSDFTDDFTNKMRAYLEECDSLQGFHLTVDVVNAFGGLASSCIEYIKDEYDKKSVLVYAAIPSYYGDYSHKTSEQREESTKKDSIRLINTALSLESLSENSSLVVPVCLGCKGWRQPGPKRKFSHINYNSELPYHTSAILASTLDTLSLMYRTKRTQYTMHDFCADLNGHGRRIAAASAALPFPIKAGVDLIDCLDNWDGPLTQNLTPNCDIGRDKILQVISARGISEHKLKREAFDDKGKKQREMPAYRCESVQEMLTFYLSCSSYATASHVSCIEMAMSVKPPFPDIFDEFVGNMGEVLVDTTRNKNNEVIKSVPVIAGCHSGSAIGDMLETLHRESERIKIGRFKQFELAGLENDTYKESMEKLLELRECYYE